MKNKAGPAQDPWPPKPSRSGPGPLAPKPSRLGPGPLAPPPNPSRSRPGPLAQYTLLTITGSPCLEPRTHI